jgi:uncharacterized MAPEG superfamily protein
MTSINISIISLPAFWLMNMLTHGYAMSQVFRQDPKLFDNRNPRGMSLEALKKAIGPERFSLYERAKAVHNNGHEHFPLFAAAVLAGNFAGVDGRFMDGMALAVLGLRVVYTWSYLTARTRAQSFVRTIVWNVSFLTCFYTLYRAAKEVR